MAVSHAQLKAFHAVATCESFTRAAERLCLSQPRAAVLPQQTPRADFRTG